MNDVNQDKGKGKGCLRNLVIGCGAVAALFFILIIILALNWNEIQESDFVRSLNAVSEAAKAEMENMIQLGDDLQSKYPSDDIGVQTGSHSITGSDVTTYALSVEFLNPQFTLPAANDKKRKLAQEIAIDVATLYPGIERYQLINIAFTTQSGGGIITQSSGVRYDFEVHELLRQLEGEGDVSP